MIAPANRQAVLTWSDLDDLVTDIARAKASLEAIHMVAEHPALPKHATAALQEVCDHARILVAAVAEGLEAAMSRCNVSRKGGPHHG